MAKSLRSKSKRSFRANKRQDSKSAYKQIDDARTARLHARLMKGKERAVEAEGDDEVMDAEVDAAEPAAVEGTTEGLAL